MNSEASSTWATRLVKGQTFENFEELKRLIIDCGVQTERVLRTYKKDSKRCLVGCIMNNPSVPGDVRCPMRIRAWVSKKTGLTITKANLSHTCEASHHWTRRMHTKADRLADQIFEILMRNKQTRASSLRDTAQALVHPDIKYHTAYSAKKKALERLDGKEKDSFHLIPAHCRHILERDPRATVKYSAPDGHFATLFVCPGAAREAFKHCRPLLAFDGTHTRSSYPQILLIATAMDGNNTVLMLAYMMVPTENAEEWLKFLRLMSIAIPELGNPGMVFISDREKGLLAGVDEVFPRGFHAFCAWHLGDNCRTRFNKKAQKAFEPLVYAVTPEQFQRRLDRIRESNAELAEYIERTADPKNYSRAFCPVKRWGHETSQQAESLNRALKPQRQEIAFRQSHLLWDYMMTKMFEKRELAASITTPFPPNIMALLRRTEEKATQLIADPSSDTECRITDSFGRQFLVRFLPSWTCTCGDWQDTLLLCVHAWRACTRLRKRHFDYVSPFYSTVVFQATYATNVPAILHDGLLPDSNCGPPLIRRKRGRPSEKARPRFAEEETARRARRCGLCAGIGHDRRICPQRDIFRSQAAGKGPTIESDDELAEDVETLLPTRRVDGDAGRGQEGIVAMTYSMTNITGDASEESDSDTVYLSEDSGNEEADYDFTIEAVVARKEGYKSDDNDCFQSGQEVIEAQMSQPGYYSQLLASVEPHT